MSMISYKETLIEMQAKGAALQRKLKFAASIAEQQRKLDQLKIQQELEEIKAQEAIYQMAVDEEADIDANLNLPSLFLPTQRRNPPTTDNGDGTGVDLTSANVEHIHTTSLPERPVHGMYEKDNPEPATS